MASGLSRFLVFLDADRLDVVGVPQAGLRRRFAAVKSSG
jgi:hypothetical protein